MVYSTVIGQANDIPAIIDLLNVLFAQEHDFSPNTVKQQAGLRAIISDASKGHFLVTRDDAGKAIACVSLLYLISTAEGGKVALLEDMVVHPDYRQKGVGKALLKEAISFAKQQICSRITLLTDHDNHSAQSLYEKLGFEHSSMVVMRQKI
jgi:ribosomal protein S18 acetylase RimI-like enzyme